MSPAKRRGSAWFSILVAIFAISAAAEGVTNVRSLPDDRTFTDIFFTLLISGNFPLLLFVFAGLVMAVSRFLRWREKPVIKAVRQFVEAQSPSITIRRIREVGDSSGSAALVSVQHGLAPPQYSLYEVDRKSLAVAHNQDSTWLPPNLNSTA